MTDEELQELALQVNPISVKRKAENAPLRPYAFREQKYELIEKALLQTEGNKVKAAKLLGISRKQLWIYRKQMGLV